MSTYLKHIGGYAYKQLKGKSFDEIQKLFEKEIKRVNTFVAMGSEVQESKEKKVEGSEETTKGSRKMMLGRRRAGKEQQQESSKKQKREEEKEPDEVEEVEEDDEAELKKLLVIKKDKDITIDAIPLATKLPVIIDYKLHKEDRQDLEVLWRIVKAKYSDTRPEDEFERVSRNLKIQKMNIKFRGGLLGLKRLHGFLEVTTAQRLVISLFVQDYCFIHNTSRFGINKWYQSFALRNFDLEDMELESTNSGPTAKLPILKLGEYEMWVIRIKQYFQIQDYALWEVIENGDSWVSVPSFH
ncbi:hypothetical protein Tco_0701625 [Tanacetum coccineum]